MGNAFLYDKNGNQIKDSDRKICAIQYNLLNLPQIIQFENGNQIVHCYDAEGRRYQTVYYTRLIPLVEPATDIVSITSSAGYLRRTQAIVGNKRYLAMQNIWSLDYVFNPEGYTRISATGRGGTEYYYIKDYLGNVREVYKRVSSTQRQLAQRTQYYPSGLPWGSGTGVSEQPFKYNGKEFVEMHGLDEYDSEARWYYPQLMRTTTMDPLCEKYYSLSPYSWCANNPVKLIDPDGRDASAIINEAEKTITIRASYVAYESDVESAQQAVDFWNQQSGIFLVSMDGEDYELVFSLEVVNRGEPISDEKASNRQFGDAAKACSTFSINSYVVVPNYEDSNKNGATKAKNQITVKESRSKTETGAHEVGHTLYMDHSFSGIMTPSSSDKNRSMDVPVRNISQMLQKTIEDKSDIVVRRKLVK